MGSHDGDTWIYSKIQIPWSVSLASGTYSTSFIWRYLFQGSMMSDGIQHSAQSQMAATCLKNQSLLFEFDLFISFPHRPSSAVPPRKCPSRHNSIQSGTLDRIKSCCPVYLCCGGSYRRCSRSRSHRSQIQHSRNRPWCWYCVVCGEEKG
ncbi:hypothetical protein J3F84DRAFT_241887 [Trichoderma pleuroticola]